MTIDKIDFNNLSYLNAGTTNFFSPSSLQSNVPLFDFTSFSPGNFQAMDVYGTGMNSFSMPPLFQLQSPFFGNFQAPKVDPNILMQLYKLTLDGYKNQLSNFKGFNFWQNTPVNTGNKSNDEKIAELNPVMQSKVQNLLAYAQSQGMEVKITSGFRTQAEQQRLQVTRAGYAAKNSLHCQGKAVDISITNGTDADYKKLGDYAKSIGMRWGGDFSSVKERWHFDLGWA